MNDKQIKYNRLYMDIAERIAEMSYARRLKVGSVLVKNDNIISFGWNGTPNGFDNNCENESFDAIGNIILETKSEVLHAEANCLMKLTKTTNTSENAILYVTHAPCINCAKLIHQAGIKILYYRNIYRSDEGIKFLEKCGLEIKKI